MLRALEIGSELGDRALSAYTQGNLGLIALRRAHLIEADRRFRAQLETGLEIGDRTASGQALANLANVRMAYGDPEGAFLTLDQAVEIAKAIGDVPMQAHTMLHQAYILRRYRDAAGSRAKLDEASAFIDRNDTVLEAEACVDRGALAILEDDHETARRELDRGYELAIENSMQETASYALLYGAMIPGGDPEKARAQFASMRDSTGVLQREHALYLLWKATGDPAVLDEAHEHLEIILAHSPPDRHAAIVDNVPMRAEYVAAWREAHA
jgi:ATP/maltotriose-dependent transcriptional regulator MalT